MNFFRRGEACLARFGACLALFLLLIGCTPQSETFHAFGTLVTVEIEDISPQQSKKLFTHIDQALQNMHHRWHAWQDSELLAIRKACQTGETIFVSEDVAHLIQEGAVLEKQSNGYFNPAIGELIDAWGFLSQTSGQDRLAPSPEVIEKLLSYHPSLQNINIKNGQLTCDNPHVRLDFGAYAKGYGVGKIMDYLQSQGVKQALINAGGDVMILQAPGKRARRIGIVGAGSASPVGARHASPAGTRDASPLLISQSTSIFTSGTYARNFKDHQTQKQYHHLINPKTGYPSTYFISVTVLHPDPMRADAAATALLAADQESWLSIVEKMGIEKYLLITKEGETIRSLGS